MKDDKNATTHISDLILLHSTAGAHLFQTHEGTKVWIPKSQVFHMELGKDMLGPEMKTVKEVLDLELPLWLAQKNGMI